MKIFVLFIFLHSIFCFPLTIFKTITRSQTIWYIIRISMWLRAGKKKSNSIKNFTQFAALYIFRYFLLVTKIITVLSRNELLLLVHFSTISFSSLSNPYKFIYNLIPIHTSQKLASYSRYLQDIQINEALYKL